MKKSKLTEEQIAFALRQAESGTRVVEVCRTFPRYRSHRRDDPPSDCGSRRRGFGTGIVGSRSCFGARAGASIISGPTGSTARRASI